MAQPLHNFIPGHAWGKLKLRYDLEITKEDLVELTQQLCDGYWVLMANLKWNRMRVMTRYKGRYIVLVTNRWANALITALPYLEQNLEFVEQFVKEFG